MQQKTRLNSLIVLLVSGILLLALGFLVNQASAEALPRAASPTSSTAGQAPECWPLDVVVLIDESLSMSRPSGNDPQGYRFLAAKEILNLLISNRRAQCTDAVHRFGVIVFGDYVSTTVALAPVDILPKDDRTVWSQPIVEAIDGIAKYRPAQQGTDPKLAFEEADKLLASASALPTPASYGPRRQVVILLTDGNPEGVRVGGLEKYMRTLPQSLSAQNWAKRSIWIVALNAKYLGNTAFDDKSMRQVWSEIATNHNGRLLGEDKYDEQTIPAALGTIIDEEFGQPGKRIQCGDFYVDPYLQSVRFVFSKRLEHQNKLIILSKLDDGTGEETYRFVDGKTDLANVTSPMIFRENEYRRDGIIEEYVFDFPLPGRWRFTIEGLDENACRSGVDARQTMRTAKVSLKEPSHIVAQYEEAPYYDMEVPLPLLLRLESTDGQPIPLPDYPMDMQATVHLPSGKTQLPDGSLLPTYTFSRTAEGLWQSVPTYTVAPEAGIYTLAVNGVSVHEISRTEFAVFTETLTYEVRKLGRLRFEIQGPTAGQSLPCNTVEDRKPVGNPVPLTVQLLDPTGQSADASFYLSSSPAQSFEAIFLDAGGNQLGAVPLAPATQGVGIFEGTLLANQPAVIGCGAVSTQVTFTGTVDETRFSLPLRTQTVSFNRPPSEGVLVTITAPMADQQFLLHPDFWAARNADMVDPVKLAFALTDLREKPMLPTTLSRAKWNVHKSSVQNVHYFAVEMSTGRCPVGLSNAPQVNRVPRRAALGVE